MVSSLFPDIIYCATKVAKARGDRNRDNFVNKNRTKVAINVLDKSLERQLDLSQTVQDRLGRKELAASRLAVEQGRMMAELARLLEGGDRLPPQEPAPRRGGSRSSSCAETR